MLPEFSAGGFGKVYLARNTFSSTFTSIKILKTKFESEYERQVIYASDLLGLNSIENLGIASNKFAGKLRKINRAIKSIVNSLKLDVQQLIAEVLLKIKRLLLQIKGLTSEILRMIAIARGILNRLAQSPSGTKTEPPVGGIKVGGSNMAVMLPKISTLSIKQTA